MSTTTNAMPETLEVPSLFAVTHAIADEPDESKLPELQRQLKKVVAQLDDMIAAGALTVPATERPAWCSPHAELLYQLLRTIADEPDESNLPRLHRQYKAAFALLEMLKSAEILRQARLG